MAKYARTGFFWLVALALVSSLALSLHGQFVLVAFAGGAPLVDEQTYEIQVGDTLFSIADHFDISVAELIQANGLQGNIILIAGDTLIIPTFQEGEAENGEAETSGAVVDDSDAVAVPNVAIPHTEKGQEEAAVTQDSKGMAADDQVEKGGMQAAPEEGIESAVTESKIVLQTYRVQRRDSLGHIAHKFGVSVQELAAINGLHVRSFLHRYQILTIPPSSASAKSIIIDIPAAQSELDSGEAADKGGEAAPVDEPVGEDAAKGTEVAENGVNEVAVEEDTAVDGAIDSEIDPAEDIEAIPPENGDPEMEAPAGEDEPGAETPDTDAINDDEETGAAPNGAVPFAQPEPAPEAAGGVIFWSVPDAPVAVFSPVAGGAYHSALDVTGLSRTFEGNVSMYLVNEAGEILARRFANGGTLDMPNFFHTQLRFTVTEPTPALLKVFEIDASDGSRINEVQIPISLLPGQRAIDIDRPAVGDDLCALVFVTGYSNTFEATVILELWGEEGELLEQTITAGGTLGVYRNFFAAFDTTVSVPTPIFVAAYEEDASGRFDHIDKTVIPATLFPDGAAACD